ncbi:MAG: Cyclic di-GMP phosphodiesterase response regulator RpfG [Nitrospira sp.]|nr:Cyclic di-GMP phosphodiesterase response regulator RpfG [Nitrospira sp.]
MLKMRPIWTFVVGMVAASAAALVLSSSGPGRFPGAWGLFVFLSTGVLLELSSTQAKVGGITGSVSFLVDLGAPLLFGGFWGGVIVGSSALFSNLALRKEPIRVVFNTGQRVLSVVAAAAVYGWVGGTTPPDFLVNPSALPFAEVVRGILAFLAGAFAYFLTNSIAVSCAVAISERRPLERVWRTITLYVIGYDLSASLVCLLVAWAYLEFDSDAGAGRLVLLVVFLPFVAARHVYGKLSTLQQLYGELDQAYEKLELALREQLEMMVKSIEARDPYTSGHSRRVSALSKAIAVDLGITGPELDEIENAALLHDVGKIHEEFAPLLKKEGRLTQDEWEIMKTHAAKSADLVGLFSRFRGPVQSAVRSHHERWDGKGYPDGMATESIPLGARIIMIADTIDAMTTDRPYRGALPFEKIVAELQKYRGSQFDPSVVDMTVNSVTVRRLVSDKQFLAEQTAPRSAFAVGRPPRPALRSQSSFLDAARAGGAPASGAS